MATKPTLKLLAKKLKPDAKGVSRLARIECPPLGGPCQVKAPKRVRVKIGGSSRAKVIVRRTLGAGQVVVVRPKLGKATVEALAGGSFKANVRVVVTND